jgi:two-component system, sensor histidine kinase and response regulator
MTIQNQSENLDKPLVLIVDDLPQNLQILGNILKKIECRITFSTSGKQALELIHKLEVDLVLLDILMPDMDGFEVCRILKLDPATSEIPIIFLTAAKKESNDVVEGFRRGAVDYITKPINEEELIARVNTHLELKKSRQTIVRKNHELNEFLHILCHDLANPFNSMESLFDLYENNVDLLGQIFTGLKISVKNGQAIINLVREMSILDESGGKLPLERLSLLEAAQESEIILGHRFKKKKVDLKIKIDQDLTVLAERTSLVNSVLNNILTNALKFSFPGDTVEVLADRDNDTVQLTIKDFGTGMTESHVEGIFEINRSTSCPGTQGETGTGFGMRLVKKYISAYDATIEIKSSDKISSLDNHGTTVFIRFPVN